MGTTSKPQIEDMQTIEPLDFEEVAASTILVVLQRFSENIRCTHLNTHYWGV